MKPQLIKIIPVPMTANPDVSGGLVSESTMPVDDARRIVTELRSAGVESDWSPDVEEHGAAWLYVTEAKTNLDIRPGDLVVYRRTRARC